MQDLIRKIILTIDKAVNDFNAKIPGIQAAFFDDLQDELRALNVKSGRVITSVENLRAINKVKNRLDNLVRSKAYTDAVKSFISTFDDVTKLQNEYFSQVSKKFGPSRLTDVIKETSIQNVVNQLTENGLSAVVSDRISTMLNQNISAGASYAGMLNQLRDYILTTDTGLGVLERYTKQITTDSLNQFSAEYTQAVTADLGLEWFMYTGPVIETSRVLCEALVKKKYVHRSELADIVKGEFAEFRELEGRINPKTKLPEGMIAGTDATNFSIYRGGYNCNHQLVPVSVVLVPVDKILQIKPAVLGKASKKKAGLEV
jgi:hypothetical protein